MSFFKLKKDGGSNEMGRQDTKQKANFIRKGYLVVLILTSLFGVEHAELEAQQLKPIDADLNSGTLKETLPFDVPFQIKGPVTAELQSVSVKYRDITVQLPDQSPQWKVLEKWQRFKGFTGDHFHIVVPALEANRSYEFAFEFTRKLTDEELEGFRKLTKDALDRALQSAEDVDDIEWEDFQKTLIQMLPKPLDAELKPIRGSIFDTQTPIPVEMRLKQVITILTPQAARLGLIAGLDGRYKATVENLKQYKNNGIFPAIEEAIRTVLTTDQAQAYQPFLEWSQLGRKLTELSDKEAERIAAGLEPLALNQAAPLRLERSFQRIWKPTDADSRIENLQKTRTTIQNLRSLVRLVLRDKTLRETDDTLQSVSENLITRLESTGSRVEGVLNDLMGLSRILQQRDNQITALANQLQIQATDQVAVYGNSVGNFDTRAQWYVSADAGLAYAIQLEDALPYFGLNFYLRPVNKDAPLNLKGGFRRRFAFMIGVTLESIKVEKQREDLFANRALVLGIGYRLTDTVRLSVGSLVFQEFDPNPLVSTKKDPAFDLFASVSFDWDIADTFGVLGKAITGEK